MNESRLNLLTLLFPPCLLKLSLLVCFPFPSLSAFYLLTKLRCSSTRVHVAWVFARWINFRNCIRSIQPYLFQHFPFQQRVFFNHKLSKWSKKLLHQRYQFHTSECHQLWLLIVILDFSFFLLVVIYSCTLFPLFLKSNTV